MNDKLSFFFRPVDPTRLWWKNGENIYSTWKNKFELNFYSYFNFPFSKLYFYFKKKINFLSQEPPWSVSSLFCSCFQWFFFPSPGFYTILSTKKLIFYHFLIYFRVLERFFSESIQNFDFEVLKPNILNEIDFWESFSHINREYFFLFDLYSLAIFLNKMKEKSISWFKSEPIIPKQKVESRYNFASLLGGAKILEKNQDCLYEKSVLDDNPDK